MTEEFPLYVREEAARLANDEGGENPNWTANTIVYTSTGSALCRLLAATMPVPVDPDLIEAREIVARAATADGNPQCAANYRAGRHDKSWEMRLALAALKSRPKP